MGPFFIVDYETHIDRDVLLTLNPDINRDAVLSEAEKKDFLERLSSVFILIGVLTVTSSGLADRFSQNRSWIQRLPVFSAGCIMLIGIAVAFNAFHSSGIIRLNW
jgi:hypothetical protein